MKTKLSVAKNVKGSYIASGLLSLTSTLGFIILSLTESQFIYINIIGFFYFSTTLFGYFLNTDNISISSYRTAIVFHAYLILLMPIGYSWYVKSNNIFGLILMLLGLIAVSSWRSIGSILRMGIYTGEDINELILEDSHSYQVASIIVLSISILLICLHIEGTSKQLIIQSIYGPLLLLEGLRYKGISRVPLKSLYANFRLKSKELFSDFFALSKLPNSLFMKKYIIANLLSTTAACVEPYRIILAKDTYNFTINNFLISNIISIILTFIIIRIKKKYKIQINPIKYFIFSRSILIVALILLIFVNNKNIIYITYVLWNISIFYSALGKQSIVGFLSFKDKKSSEILSLLRITQGLIYFIFLLIFNYLSKFGLVFIFSLGILFNLSSNILMYSLKHNINY